MDLFFNDSSCECLTEESIPEKIHLFASIANEAFAQGFTGIRFDKYLRDIGLLNNLSFAHYCEKNSGDQTVRAILSLAKYPYFDDAREDAFLSADFQVNTTDNRTVSVYGLAAAFLYDSIGIGFNTSGWDRLMYDITEIGGKERRGTVLCLSQSHHFSEPSYVDWAENNLPDVVLVKSKTIPMDKHCHLSDHHGTDILDKFARKLLACPYVEEVINSIERNSNTRSFIERLRDGNIIDIRLVKEGGFGLAIKTTAKTPRQLRRIAKLIEEKYS